ncbi:MULTISPECIES: aldolase catalytic domain-containing protein [Bacillota]|uniref:Isopropylmalate/homocitrate/citramalate synthase n=1 Tax=Enterocloster clostridioformis TaxID=1531 RepID=A0A174JHW6_9FIRM|nr:aldolase catalytic domain-containing protein [Enterocloster clostridioformis]CUO97218.1 isopropylmalate/homocitrate/citramalate synthase [Enterocloster clostridioformis]
MNNKIHILDCTLRDGGYVNDWEFDSNLAKGVIDGLYESGIRVIEIGIMGIGGEAGKSTKFSSFKDAEPLLENRKKDCKYAIMINQTGFENFDIPNRSEKTVDIIRLAYFKREIHDAMIFAKSLKDKGYEVFLQAMATFMYSDDEIDDMLKKVNDLKPQAFYIVDSFSNLFPEDITSMANSVLSRLNRDIDFGFHAHNNIQMAFANAIAFMNVEDDRKKYIDGSIYGMGRGAGNVPVELLMDYLNRRVKQYNIEVLLKTYQDYIKPIFEQYFWGYTHPYYLTASKDMNSVYSWFFMNKGIGDIVELNKALNMIKDSSKYTLMKDEAAEVLIKIQGGNDEK